MVELLAYCATGQEIDDITINDFIIKCIGHY
jgi:hypothetical protein